MDLVAEVDLLNADELDEDVAFVVALSHVGSILFAGEVVFQSAGRRTAVSADRIAIIAFFNNREQLIAADRLTG